MKKNYPHNVIRIRKGKKVKPQILWIIAILNKKKMKSLKIFYKLGYIQFGKKGYFVINLKKLGLLLNKGFILNKNAKKLLTFII